MSSRLFNKKTGMATGKVGAAVVVMVAGFEGLRHTVYADPVGIPTACFGYTRGLTKDMIGRVKFTDAQCQAMLTEELVIHEEGMRKCLVSPDTIPLSVYGASLSFTYNVGIGRQANPAKKIKASGFCGSTMAKLINQGQYAAACNELPKWVKSRGITFPGLVKRRAAERAYCLSGLPEGAMFKGEPF